MTKRIRVQCAYCGLSGHRAVDCYVSARGALRPDALDLAIGSIDFQGLRDRPADLRFAVSRVIRQCINRGKA